MLLPARLLSQRWPEPRGTAVAPRPRLARRLPVLFRWLVGPRSCPSCSVCTGSSSTSCQGRGSGRIKEPVTSAWSTCRCVLQRGAGLRSPRTPTPTQAAASHVLLVTIPCGLCHCSKPMLWAWSLSRRMALERHSWCTQSAANSRPRTRRICTHARAVRSRHAGTQQLCVAAPL